MKKKKVVIHVCSYFEHVGYIALFGLRDSGQFGFTNLTIN